MEREGKPGVRAGARLGPAERLRRSSELDRVYAAGRRGGDGILRVAVARNELGHPRVASAIGRKEGGKAHDRNRLRRLYREAFRRLKGELPAVDIILSPARGAARATFDQVCASLGRVVRDTAARLPERAPGPPPPGAPPAPHHGRGARAPRAPAPRAKERP